MNRSEFCRELALALSTLARYRRGRVQRKPTGSNTLLAVEVSGRAVGAAAATCSALAVVLRGGRRVEIGRGFDAGTLAQLVHVLEGV